MKELLKSCHKTVILELYFSINEEKFNEQDVSPHTFGGIIEMGNKISESRKKRSIGFRLNYLISAYQKFLMEKNLLNTEINRMIFVENYISSLKLNIYDEFSKHQLIKDLNIFYRE